MDVNGMKEEGLDPKAQARHQQGEKEGIGHIFLLTERHRSILSGNVSVVPTV
jgi:hypothetical protein